MEGEILQVGEACKRKGQSRREIELRQVRSLLGNALDKGRIKGREDILRVGVEEGGKVARIVVEYEGLELGEGEGRREGGVEGRVEGKVTERGREGKGEDNREGVGMNVGEGWEEG